MKLRKSTWRWAVLVLFLIIFIGIALYPLPSQDAIRYYDRETGQMKTEKIAGESWLVWLYHNPVGEATLSTLAKRKVVSTVYGNRMDDPGSAEMIEPFIKDFGVDMNIAQKKKFDTFNDFFVRKLKPEARPIAGDSTIAVSPADGKILAYENIHNADFFIKGTRFDVASFLDDPELAEKYREGSLIIVRLAPPDYHRYHFPVGGKVAPNHKIVGDYFSVNPLALRKKAEIFWLNKREYTVINNPIFGKVVMAEVGATMVGSMITTFKGNTVKKGQEKGFFKFGGSTVVLLFEKGKIKIDDDFLKNTAKGFETTVKMGERIGESL
ncbi:MAG: phosphatidylserine decarboxylase [Kaistella sp.]